MTRATLVFKSNYSRSAKSVIRGYHTYKKTNVHSLQTREVKIFEDHAVATYKDSRLVGHVPFQQNYFLFCKFIGKRNNQIFAEVNGGIKLVNGLVVPCIYHVNENKKHIELFLEERKSDTYEHKDIRNLKSDIFVSAHF